MTVAEIIEIAQISQFMAANDIAKSGLHTGGGAYLRLPRHLYLVRKNVERKYDLDPTNDTLTATSNYLLALCGKYRFAAQSVTGSGGTIAPITPGGATINDLDFIVSASSYIATGESAVTFDGTNGMPDLRGYNVDFARNGTTQYTTPQAGGALYYAWNSVTGLFQLLGTSPEALEGESFRIMPDATGGTGSSSAYSPTTISLSADGTYTLPEGYLLWKISILPTAADTVKIGTTLGGDDIMFDKVMIPNEYSTNGTTVDVYAESSDKTIYFTGFTAQATINIYLLPI